MSPTEQEPQEHAVNAHQDEQGLPATAYQEQVDACIEAGPVLLAGAVTAELALYQWIAMFVDILVSNDGLAEALQRGSAHRNALHASIADRLIPVCAVLLNAATAKNTRKARVDAYGLMRGIANLCVGAGSDSRYEPRKLVHALVSGVLAGAH